MERKPKIFGRKKYLTLTNTKYYLTTKKYFIPKLSKLHKKLKLGTNLIVAEFEFVELYITFVNLKF
jgi:hypothetical protein